MDLDMIEKFVRQTCKPENALGSGEWFWWLDLCFSNLTIP
jgi:hypothetical protein